MVKLTVRANFDDAAKAFQQIGVQAGSWALSEALTRGAMKMRTVAGPMLAKQSKPWKTNEIKGMIKPLPASKGNLVAGIRINGVTMHAGNAGHHKRLTVRQLRSGASFRPWGEVQRVKSGFVPGVQYPNSGGLPPSIFVRKGKARLPIKNVGYGPNPALELRRMDKPARIEVLAQGSYATQRRLASNVDRIVKRAKGKYGV